MCKALWLASLSAGAWADSFQLKQGEVDVCLTIADVLQQRTSHCYRIAYRSMERSLTDEVINTLQAKTREVLANDMKVELR